MHFSWGGNRIHLVVVSYESLELQGEENCRCPYERHLSARGYFWLLIDMDKVSFPCSSWIHKLLSLKLFIVFCPTTSIQAVCYCDLSVDSRDHTFTVRLDTFMGHLVISRKFDMHSGDLQLVHVKSVCMASHVQSPLIHRGNHTLVIIEGKVFSFVRPPWSSLVLESVYSHVHLLPFVSSVHGLHCGVLQNELEVVSLMNLEFVGASSDQGDVTVLCVHQSPTFRVVQHANSSLCGFMISFVLLGDCFYDDLVYGLISSGPLVFGVAPDVTRNIGHAIEFEDSCYKPKARRIGPLEVLRKFKVLVYMTLVPADACCSDVFNIKHLFKYESGDMLLSGFVDESFLGEGT